MQKWHGKFWAAPPPVAKVQFFLFNLKASGEGVTPPHPFPGDTLPTTNPIGAAKITNQPAPPPQIDPKCQNGQKIDKIAKNIRHKAPEEIFDLGGWTGATPQVGRGVQTPPRNLCPPPT